MTYSVSCAAFDLDGTLLRSDGTISPETRRCIGELQSRGCLCTIATGRMFSSAAPLALSLGMTNLPIITYNGSYLRIPGEPKPLWTRGIPRKTAEELLEFCASRGWYVQSYSPEDELLVEQHRPWTDYYEKLAGVKARALGKTFFSPPSEPLKILLAADTEEEFQHIFASLNQRFGKRVFLAGSQTPGGRFLEVVAPDVNKGQALHTLCGLKNIPENHTLAFGDSENDVPLFQAAGLSVAMGNAAPEIRSRATCVTASNDEEGIAAFFAQHQSQLLFPRS